MNFKKISRKKIIKKIILFIYIVLFSNDVFLQGSMSIDRFGDTSLYSLDFWGYSNESQTMFWENGNIGIIHKVDSLDINSSLFRFYKTGGLSLHVQNYNLKETLDTIEGYFVYTIAGNVRTYYQNGRLRSSYNIDKNGLFGDTAHFYRRDNGENHLTNISRNGLLYDGFYLTDYFDEKKGKGVLIIFLKKGEIRNVFYIHPDKKVYRVRRNKMKISALWNNMRYKKFDKTFNLFSDEMLDNSGDNSFPEVWDFPYFSNKENKIDTLRKMLQLICEEEKFREVFGDDCLYLLPSESFDGYSLSEGKITDNLFFVKTEQTQKRFLKKIRFLVIYSYL